MATRIGKAVDKAIAKRRRKAKWAKAGKALKVAGTAAALVGALAGVAVGARAGLKMRAAAKAKKGTLVQKLTAKARKASNS